MEPLDTPEGKLKCPYCHSFNTKSNGYVYTKKEGKTNRPRMKCNDCGKGWTVHPPTEAKFAP